MNRELLESIVDAIMVHVHGDPFGMRELLTRELEEMYERGYDAAMVDNNELSRNGFD